MCTTCGCGGANVHDHVHGGVHEHGEISGHHHAHTTADRHDYGGGAAGMEVPGLSQHRIIQIESNILAKNDEYAAANRARLAAAGITAFNFMSSPGSGKTTLLVRAISDLRHRYRIAVVEGDQQTSNDAERIRATGAPAIQVNTGKGCHLDAHMVGHALDALALPAGGLLFIENVGNLVCPAAFDLGEAYKVVVFSVTEGEDKPIKYPDMFAAADLMLINKSDLVPHLDFDLARTIDYAHRVNPGIDLLVVSARSGEGFSDFYDWIDRNAKPIIKPARVARHAAE